MLTAAQVQSAIEVTDEKEWGASEWYEEVAWERGDKAPYALTIDGQTYVPEYVADHGGMDRGSDRWVVFKLGDQLFKKSGYYASHYGTDWDGELREVKPVQKTITVFE